MTEQQRKHQHYLAHIDEYKERSKQWAIAHRERKREIVKCSKAKRMASMSPAELTAFKHKRSERVKAYRISKIASETPEERAARLERQREYGALRRRRAGIEPRKRMTKEEQRTHNAEKSRRYYYTRHNSDNERKQYERDRKRAYRERIRQQKQ